MLGIAIVAFTLGIMLMAYLFLFGALIGLVLYSINWIRNYFLPKKQNKRIKTQGRIIESKDWKKM